MAAVCAGWQFSNYLQKAIAIELEKQLEAHKGKYSTDDELITAALLETFNQIENFFLETTRKANQLGFAHVGDVGSCALIAVVHNNAVYCANLGDSKGYLVFSSPDNKKVSVKKINNKQNADSKKEQTRLRLQFPNDSDIVVCKRGSQLCYVKNVLQPTRVKLPSLFHAVSATQRVPLDRSPHTAHPWLLIPQSLTDPILTAQTFGDFRLKYKEYY